MNTAIGIDDIHGQPIFIDTSKHIDITGKSGMGKSTLLLNLLVESVRQGNGAGLLDPHGDLADSFVRLIPKARMRDVIWFDPDALLVPGLNIFDYDDPNDKELGTESFATMMKSFAGPNTGPESERVWTNAADAVVEHYERPTAIHIFRFMADDNYREKILKETANPLLKMFSEQYDKKLRDSEQMSKFSPPINKVGKLLRPQIMPIIGQTKSLDFLDIMNSRKILICRFSKGRLGEEVAQILGSLVVSMISIAALKREKQKKRPPFMLVADEVHNFTHGGRFGTLLAESRKYGITLVTASQGRYQLPFARDLDSNSPTQIVFNVSGEDALQFELNWNEPFMTATKITNLPRYQFLCRTFTEDRPAAFHVFGYDNIKKRGDEANATKLIKQSLMRYGVKKKTTVEKINKFLSS